MSTLVTTPAAANANSYATLVEATTYNEAHGYGSVWAIPSGEQIAKLIRACRFLDTMPGAWTGAAATAAQVLGWPRTGMKSRNDFAIASGEIPSELKDAQAEFARHLVEEDSTESNVILALGITSVKAGPVAVAFGNALSQREAAVNSNRAYAMMIPDSVKVLLVPSWLSDPRDEDAVYSGLLVEAL